MGLSARPSQQRHCEELATKLRGNFALKRRSNPESLHGGSLDCFAALAMTAEVAPHLEGPAKGGRLEGWPRARAGPSWFSRRCEASSGDARSALLTMRGL